jgi:hypothetical protein
MRVSWFVEPEDAQGFSVFGYFGTLPGFLDELLVISGLVVGGQAGDRGSKLWRCQNGMHNSRLELPCAQRDIGGVPNEW